MRDNSIWGIWSQDTPATATAPASATAPAKHLVREQAFQTSLEAVTAPDTTNSAVPGATGIPTDPSMRHTCPQ